MNVASIRLAAAAWLRRAGGAAARWLGWSEPAGSGRSADEKARVLAPFCVSYGRVVFRLYYPKPRPAPGHEARER